MFIKISVEVKAFFPKQTWAGDRKDILVYVIISSIIFHSLLMKTKQVYHPRAKEKTIPPAPQKMRWLRRWKEHLAWVYPFFPTETLESQRHESKESLDGPGREPLACLLPFHHSSLHLRNKRRAHFPEGGELLSEITRRWRSRMAFRRPCHVSGQSPGRNRPCPL